MKISSRTRKILSIIIMIILFPILNIGELFVIVGKIIYSIGLLFLFEKEMFKNEMEDLCDNIKTFYGF